MIPIKTKIPVLVNKHTSELKTIFLQINNVLDKSLYLEFGRHFKSDLCFLLHHFYQGNSSIEYETLFITCLNGIIDEIQFGKSINYIRVLGAWSNLDNDKKNIFLSLTKENIVPQNSLNSILFLTNKVDIEKINLIKDFIIKISEDFINADNYIDENENEKLNELKELIKSSNNKIDNKDLQTYIHSKFKELSLVNNEKVVEDPIGIKELLVKNQEAIVSLDNKYVLDILKIHNFLKIKHEQILKTINSINNDVKVFETIDRLSALAFEQVNSYNIVYYYSLNMIVSLLEKNYVLFYELYEEFDELGIFKNKFERELIVTMTDVKNEIKDLKNDVVKKLTIIENQLEKVVNGINQINKNLSDVINNLINIEESISNGFNSLNHTLDSNFKELNNNLINGLEDLNSTVATGNLINAISAYQLYKINKQTKPLLS